MDTIDLQPAISATDPGYDDARASWNLTFDHRPARICEPSSTAEVVAAVLHARGLGLDLVVQSTGHGAVRPADPSSLLISLRHLDDVVVDPAARTATVGGGARLEQVLAAAAPHGLAPIIGSSPGVGVVGFTVGGGFGWLGREHGLAVDHVRSLTMVTADGGVVTASPSGEREVYWATLGAGGGGLGVVVEMTIDLVPVATVTAGNLLYPFDAAEAVLDRWLDWVDGMPSAMTTSFLTMAFPELEMVPPPLRGQRFAIVRGCHCGDPDEAAALLDHWRGWRPPVADQFGPMPFAQMAAISQDPVDPVPALTSGRWLRSVDAPVLPAMQALVDRGALFAEIRHAGGAVARHNPAVSFDVRDGAFTLEGVFITPTPEIWAHARACLDGFVGATAASHAERPGYLNFVEGEERQAMVEQAFAPETRERWRAVKQQLDPGDVFSHGLSL